MTKLFAVPHDGTFEGDSMFYPGETTSVPYERGMKLEQIRVAFIERLTSEWCLTEADELVEVREQAKEIVGAWIVTEQWIEAVGVAVNKVPPGGDSAAYAMSSIIKSLTDSMCVDHIGKRPKN